MADGYILNAMPVSYGPALSLIVEMLVSAGWTYKASGDGLSAYSATGKVFSGTGQGAGGWGNPLAWARVSDPAGGRELCVQHNGHTGSGAIRWKYSRSAKFIGGTPSATRVPSATDERVLWGGGTDAAPTLNGWFGTNTLTGACKFHGRANGAAPYGFWVCSNNTPGTAIQCGLMMDPVTSVPEDIDPVIFSIGTTGAYGAGGWSQVSGIHNTGRYVAPGGTTQGCFAHRDAAATAFEQYYPAFYALGSSVEHGAAASSGEGPYLMGRTGGGQNAMNAKYEAMPVPYMRGAVGLSNISLKGWGTLARWQWMTRVHAVDTLDNKNWIAIGQVWLPWDGATLPSN